MTPTPILTALYDWIREDLPLSIKMRLLPRETEAFAKRLDMEYRKAEATTYMGFGEIQEYAGVNRNTIYFRMTKPDFPAPAFQLKIGKVWRSADIIEYFQKHPLK